MVSCSLGHVPKRHASPHKSMLMPVKASMPLVSQVDRSSGCEPPQKLFHKVVGSYGLNGLCHVRMQLGLSRVSTTQSTHQNLPHILLREASTSPDGLSVQHHGAISNLLGTRGRTQSCLLWCLLQKKSVAVFSWIHPGSALL